MRKCFSIDQEPFIQWGNLRSLYKNKSRIKLLKSFEQISKSNQTINSIMVSYCNVNKTYKNQLWRRVGFKTYEEETKQYNKLIKKGWQKYDIFKSYWKQTFSDYAYF